jgi:predicted Zn-dependent peptidase
MKCAADLSSGGSMKIPRFLFALVLAVACLPCVAQDMASFEKRITVKKLDNGLTLVVLERPEAPVFSFFTIVDSGSVQDPKGETGLAHMFEHMAFKGTETIGSKNWPAEKAALEKVERTYAAYREEKYKEGGGDPNQVKELEKAWKDAVAEAQQYVVVNKFEELLESNGAKGVNAFTSYDETAYHYSLPSNRLELWAYLESERFLHPVMREFYKERDVVIEERRMRTDSSPNGRLFEQFLASAFGTFPYHRPTVGWFSDLNYFSATDATNFFKQNYVPSNMVVAVVGDVKPAEVVPVVEKYFGRLPARPKPEPVHTAEPPQSSEREVALHETAQPLYVEGYHRPNYRDPDDAVYDAITDLMSSGRTSRLFRSLVRDQKIAAQSAGFTGLPGTKYEHLFAFYAVPLPGHTPDEMRKAIRAEIERLKTTDVTDEELRMVKTRAKANLIRSLADNPGLAQQLGIIQTRYGDWRELFRQVERIEKVTKEDIRRVANKTFQPSNRTVGIIETRASATGANPQAEKEQ